MKASMAPTGLPWPLGAPFFLGEVAPRGLGYCTRPMSAFSPSENASVPRRVWGSTGWMVAGRLWSSVCTLAVLWLCAQNLELSAFGRLTFYLALFGVLDALVDLGTGQATVQLSSRDPDLLGSLLMRARRTRLVVGLGAAATLALGAFLMNEPDAGWIALAGLYPLTHTLELSTVALRNRIQWKPQVAMRSIASGLRLALVTGAILMGETRAGVILVLIASASTMGNILLHRVGKPLLPRVTFQAVPMGPFLRLALPLGIAALAQQLYFYVDNLFVRAHWGEASVGTYNVAVRIMSWSLSLAVYAAAAALPWLSRAHKRGELVPAAMRLTLPLTLGASLAVALLWPFAGDLLALFGEPFRAAEGALQLLLLAVICVHAGAPLTTALVAAGRTPAILALTLSALLINLGLNSLWVPTEGLVGAARATLITEGWIAVGAALSLILRARR